MIKALFCCFVALFSCCASQPSGAEDSSGAPVFLGTIERLAPNPGIVSGNLAIYQLAKYRVERLCAGRYDADEIVVDHVILTGKELENFKVGDRVCVAVERSDTVFSRVNVSGIRESSENVKVFFIGNTVTLCNQARDCTCCFSK